MIELKVTSKMPSQIAFMHLFCYAYIPQGSYRFLFLSSLLYQSHANKQLHSVQPPFLVGEEVMSLFKKGRLDRISVFRGGLLRKKVLIFFRGVVDFTKKKNKLKSETFNDKKVYKQKCFSLSVLRI